MKKIAWICLLVFAGCAKTETPTLVQGNWFMKSRDRDDTCYFALQLDNQNSATPSMGQKSLKGTYELYRGGFDLEAPGVLQGTVDGNRLSFTLSSPVNAKPSVRWREAHFSGQILPEEQTPNLTAQIKKIGFPTAGSGANETILEWHSSKTVRNPTIMQSRPVRVRLIEGNLDFLYAGETPDALHPPVNYVVTLGQLVYKETTPAPK